MFVWITFSSVLIINELVAIFSSKQCDYTYYTTLTRSALLFCIQFHGHDRIYTEKQILELLLTNEYFTTFKDACLKQVGSNMMQQFG